LCLVICTTVLHLVLQAKREGLTAKQSLSKGAGSAVAFTLSVIVLWPVTGLLGYHVRVSVVLNSLSESQMGVTDMMTLTFFTHAATDTESDDYRTGKRTRSLVPWQSKRKRND
jgi:hypothetical protein